jgi:hypothetical protein
MRRDEAGQVGGVEAVVFGVLVLVIGVLVVANAWGVIDAKLAAAAAAREAARAYVEAPDAAAAGALAGAAAEEAMTGHGRDPTKLELALRSGAFARCGRIVFEARYPVPLISIPLLGRTGTGFVVRARHSEIVDPYRSGLPGSAACATG